MCIAAISSNLMILLILFSLSWYHWIESNGLKRLSRQYHNFAMVLQELAKRTLDAANKENSFYSDKEVDENTIEIAEDFGEEMSFLQDEDTTKYSDIGEFDCSEENTTSVRHRHITTGD